MAWTPNAGAAPVASEAADGRVVIAVLPHDVTVEEIGAIPGMAPGLMSAGLGSPPPAQSFLDLTQGNRIIQSLYDDPIPMPLYAQKGRLSPRVWAEVVERAEAAPADVVPGALASALERERIPVVTVPTDGLSPIVVADRQGMIALADPAQCRLGCPAGVTLLRLGLTGLARTAASLGPDDMLVAFAAGTTLDPRLWPIGVIGPGLGGTLTSDSTRTRGLVSASDFAPTILDHFGIDPPDEMNGTRIRAEDDPDPGAVAELQRRLAEAPNRGQVVLLPLGAWVLAAGLAGVVSAARRRAARLLGLSCAWAPFALLAAAALDAGDLASALAMGVGALALAFATDRLVPGPAGFALACGATVGAHALDVVAGSPFTRFSELGPNPGGGARFYGIGNELEGILMPLTLVGAGAWLAVRPNVTPRAAAGWFLAIAAVAALAFAPGRFGADVGAAIVLGVGGVTAAVLALGIRRRLAILLVIGGGAGALAVLVVIDLVLGGAHLVGFVLGAGETNTVADVFERRTTLMLRTFTDPAYPKLLILALVLLAAGVAWRERVLAWFGAAWSARCGFLGALAGAVVGTLANDSGAVLLVNGTIYLTATAAFFWGLGITARPEAAGSAVGRGRLARGTPRSRPSR